MYLLLKIDDFKRSKIFCQPLIQYFFRDALGLDYAVFDVDEIRRAYMVVVVYALYRVALDKYVVVFIVVEFVCGFEV